MSSQGNGPARYDVRMSQHTRDVLRQRYREAAEKGTGQQFLYAFRQIYERLRNNPLTFGDPLYRLPVLKLLVYHAFVSPLVVDYAVHEGKALVLIQGFKVFS